MPDCESSEAAETVERLERELSRSRAENASGGDSAPEPSSAVSGAARGSDGGRVNVFGGWQVTCPKCSGPVRFIGTSSESCRHDFELRLEFVCGPCGFEYSAQFSSMPGLAGIRITVEEDDIRESIVDGNGNTIRKVNPCGE